MSTATDHRTHGGHDHTHSADCGHAQVQHGDHVDYVHDGTAMPSTVIITTSTDIWFRRAGHQA